MLCPLEVSSCLSFLPLPLTSTYFLILPSFLHLCFPHFLLSAVFHYNLSVHMSTLLLLFFCLTLYISKYLTFLLSLYLVPNPLFIFPSYSRKTSIYLSFPINMSITQLLLISSLSPPLVFQDIRGGNRLLQPLLSNDVSRGAIFSQETGGLPLHHPHRR